jgi:hypothetical protein
MEPYWWPFIGQDQAAYERLTRFDERFERAVTRETDEDEPDSLEKIERDLRALENRNSGKETDTTT